MILVIKEFQRASFAVNLYLSVCVYFRIHHYSIVRQPDGQLMIPDGRPFVGPVELIHHHSRYLDGFVTKPSIPCMRPNGVAPLAWPGFTMLELEFELLEEAKRKGIKKVCHIQLSIYHCTISRVPLFRAVFTNHLELSRWCLHILMLVWWLF